MAQKKYVSLSKLSTFLDNLKDTFASLIHTHTINDITDYTVDNALSPTSSNPVSNSVLDAEFEAISQALNVYEAALDDKSNINHNHDSDYDSLGSANTALQTAQTYTDEAVAQKSQVQIVTLENTESLSTLKIHKLTKEEYDEKVASGDIDENALYFTPDEEIDLSGYATLKDIEGKSDIEHTHEISDITNLQISLDEKVPTSRTINGKVLSSNITLSATDVNADISGSANTALENAKAYADTLANGKANTSHSHNDIYYTETEVDSKVSDINTSISKITNGTTVVAKATHASTSDNASLADSATKATQDASGNIITSTYETKNDANAKLEEAKAYADTVTSTVKNDLLNGAGEAYDTLKELGDLIDDNTDAIDALEIVANGKANAVHSHEISDVNNLQSELDNKSDSTHNHDSSYDAKGSADTALQTAQVYTDNAVAQKSQVQIITWEADD